FSACLFTAKANGAQKLSHLLSGSDVAHGHTLPALLEVQEGRALREDLSKDHPLAETRREAKVEALGKLPQQLSDALLVTRIQMRKAIAHDHPVDRASARLGATEPLFPHHLGIDAGSQNARPLRVNAGKQIQIDEGIVQRADQDIGKLVTQAGEMGIRPRGIDHQVVAVRERGQRGLESFQFLCFRFLAISSLRAFDLQRFRMGKVEYLTVSIGAAVLDIAGEGSLARVEIDHPNAPPPSQEGNRQVHRRGGFSRTALLVAKDDDPGRNEGAATPAYRGVRCDLHVQQALLTNANPAYRKSPRLGRVRPAVAGAIQAPESSGQLKGLCPVRHGWP